MIAKAGVLASWAPTPTTHAIRVARPRGFDFAPVQFVGLEVDTDEGPVEYPMSIASSPTRGPIEFAVRVSGSPFKKAFAALGPGDEVEVDGPYGHFVLDPARPAVLVAGGIGITPLKGMAEYASDQRLPVPVALVYSNRTPDEIVFRDELDALARANKRLKVLHTVTRPPRGDGWKGRTGRIDEALLREAAEGMQAPVYYVCGTPEMVQAMLRLMRSMGVPAGDVRQERFMGY